MAEIKVTVKQNLPLILASHDHLCFHCIQVDLFDPVVKIQKPFISSTLGNNFARVSSEKHCQLKEGCRWSFQSPSGQTDN